MRQGRGFGRGGGRGHGRGQGEATPVEAAMPGASPLTAEELAFYTSLLENMHGYVYTTASAYPVGRIYSSVRTAAVQYEVRCMKHSSCGKWISSKHVPDPRRLAIWLAKAQDITETKDHMGIWDRIVKPIH